MSKPVIVLNELTKNYGKHRGIENISFTVEQGEVFGFIGPNGAGKSTTIRTLMGLLKPTNGGASIFGLDCSREPARIAKDVGYLPSENCYYNNMKVKDINIRFLKFIKFLYPKAFRFITLGIIMRSIVCTFSIPPF